MNDEPIPLEDEIYEEEIEVEEESSVTMAMWGEITGDIDNQTDLKEALDTKQNNLTQAQLDAVNSGINSTKVETYDGYQAQINTKASQSALDTEAEARRQADSTLQGKIDAEEIARKASDKDIQDVLDGETLARQNADTALGGRIDTEIHDRQVADIALQGQIDAITSKSDVVDVVATYADLQAYDTSTLGDNDVIKVLDDETHGDALTYYRWSKTNQTWTFIGQEAPYYSKSQTDTLLLGKQNTIDSSHKLSADLVDNTSTTNKFVTASDITNWNGKQDALTAGTGIDITGGVISTPAIVPEVVAELPTTGAEGKLYLTPKAHTTSTAMGNPIEATITAQAGQLESFQLDGDTFQQTYTGKNLFNNEAIPYVSRRAYSADGSVLIWINYTGTDEYQPVEPNTEYTIWNNKARDTTYLCEYDENKNFIQRTIEATTFTTTATTKYLRWSIYVGVGEIPPTQTQLELGATSTSYEPFVGGQPSPSPSYPQQIKTVTGTQTISINGTNYPLDLGDIQLCGLGDDGNGNPLYKDRIYRDGDDWKVHKAVEKLQLVSSQGWAKSSTMATLDRYFIRDYFPSGTIPSDLSAVVVQSNYFTAISQSASDGGAYGICQLNGRGMMINTVLGAFSNNDAFKNWLDSNSVNAYYALATATDTTITDTTLIAQLEAIRTASLENGTNTITNIATGTNLAGDMEIGYFGFNPTNRYDKFIWLNLNNNYEQIGGE